MARRAWNEVKRLFGLALDLPPGGRRPWLESACPDPAIRAEVLSLLEEYSASEEFLEQPAALTPAAVDQLNSSPRPGQRIGPWLLSRELGRGGMGVVFEALRDGGDFKTGFALKRPDALSISTDPAAAEKLYLRALDIELRLLRSEPGDSVLRYNITFALSDLGLIARNRNQLEKSLRYFSQAAAIRDSFLAEDPRNVGVLNGAANLHCHLALVQAALGSFSEARKESAVCRDLTHRYAEAFPSPESCARRAASWMTAAEVEAAAAPQAPAARRKAQAAVVRSLAARGLKFASACPAPAASFDAQLGRIRKLLPEASL